MPRTEMNTSDLIIIGCGPGGYNAAEHAAKQGMSVVIFDGKHAGGTCLNEGCIPTKTFCHNADTIESLRHAEELGITAEFKFDFSKLIERKNAIVQQLRSGVEALMSAPGITFVHEDAHFKDDKIIVAGNQEYTAANIIIAAGSSPAMPPIKGIDSSHVVSSTELLDITQLPKHLCIIGGGVIGMEFASAFASFGSQVTVVEFMKECLPTLDSDIAKRLRKSMEKRGVNFYLQSKVTEITDSGIVFERKGKEEEIEADIVLVAVGRKPNTEGLQLDNTSIAFDKRGITVDDRFQTNVKGIYAIGDINGKCMLAHAAEFQGLQVVNTLAGKESHIRHEVMPSAVFTLPEVASVGYTDQQCKDEGIEFKCRKGMYRSNGKALALNETEGLVKLITDGAGHIIGCQALGAHASDMVQEATALINCGGTIEQLRNIIHIHPTLGEILLSAANQD